MATPSPLSSGLNGQHSQEGAPGGSYTQTGKLATSSGQLSGQLSPVAFASHPSSMPEGPTMPLMPQSPLSAMLSSPTFRMTPLMQPEPTHAAPHGAFPGHAEQPSLQAGSLQNKVKPPDGAPVPPTAAFTGTPGMEPSWLPPAPELLHTGAIHADPSTLMTRWVECPAGEMGQVSQGSQEQHSSASMHAPERATSLGIPQGSQRHGSSPARGGPAEGGCTGVGPRYTFLPGVDQETMQARADPPGHDSPRVLPAAEQPLLPSSAPAGTAELAHAGSGLDSTPTTCFPECPFLPEGVSQRLQDSPRGVSLPILPPASDIPTYPFRPGGGMYPAVPLELLGTLSLPRDYPRHPPHAPLTQTTSHMDDEMDGVQHC